MTYTWPKTPGAPRYGCEWPGHARTLPLAGHHRPRRRVDRRSSSTAARSRPCTPSRSTPSRRLPVLQRKFGLHGRRHQHHGCRHGRRTTDLQLGGPNGFSASVQTSRSQVRASRNGHYTLTVTSANGCKATASTVATSPTPATRDLAVTSAVCAGTDITLSATGRQQLRVVPRRRRCDHHGRLRPARLYSGPTPQRILDGRHRHQSRCKATSERESCQSIPSVTASAGPPRSECGCLDGERHQRLCGKRCGALRLGHPGRFIRWYSTAAPGTFVTLSQNPTLTGLAAGTYTYYLQGPRMAARRRFVAPRLRWPPPVITASPRATPASDCSATTIYRLPRARAQARPRTATRGPAPTVLAQA